jgi:hypothetical protein
MGRRFVASCNKNGPDFRGHFAFVVCRKTIIMKKAW